MTRRILWPISLLLALGGSSFGAVAHLQSAQGECGSAAHAGNIASNCGSVATQTFSFTATNANDGVLIAVGCGSNASTPSAISLSATGWTFTQIGGIVGSTTAGFEAAFKAYSPNTSATTVTMTWTVSGSSCSGFMNDLVDEFSGEDLTSFVDASNSGTGSGSCSV